MYKKRNIAILLLTLLIAVVGLSACAGEPALPTVGETSSAQEQHPTEEAPEQNPTIAAITHDREGYPITLPEEINTIISIGPAYTELLVALGFGDQIIATDIHSEGIEGIQPEIAVLNMMSLDAEFIINLQPDIIFITGLTRQGGEDDPLRIVSDTGIAVIYVPSSATISDIIEDIRFVTAVMDVRAVGDEIIAGMQTEIDNIRQIAESITETRTVYFELSPAPHMVSFGHGTFLHEMIELIGAENILGDMEGWVRVSDEELLSLNPDVILTSVDFIDAPIEDIMDRPGFNAITAVRNGDVFLIDTDSSNRPNHNIVIALRQIAEAVFPEYFR
ncbi:MAG: ABC transporter substrate-binding protein [Oscillospiraceae bacterium]|nr:ABC transporter substrate-binding protein [Oscillospiraceae bacterium]